MFDIGFFELVALAVLALLIFGPDKLPKVAADAARMLRELRSMATGARRELTDALGPEITELKDLGDLNPRAFVKKNFLDVLDDDDLDVTTETPRPKRGRSRPAKPTPSTPEPAADPPPPTPGYDADTT